MGFKLESVEQLPDYEDLLQSIEELKTRQMETDSLYNQFEIPEEEKPEFLEDGEGSYVVIEADNTVENNE